MLAAGKTGVAQPSFKLKRIKYKGCGCNLELLGRCGDMLPSERNSEQLNNSLL